MGRRQSEIVTRTLWIAAALAVTAFVVLIGCEGKRKSRFAEDNPDLTRSNNTVVAGDAEAAEKSTSTQEVPIPSASDELFEMAIASTVRLTVDSDKASEEIGTGYGSGVVVARAENAVYILTVWHAAELGINDVEFFSLSSDQPIATYHMPELIGKSERRDLALLRVQVGKDLPVKVAKMASSDVDPKFGYSMGCSSGRAPTLLSERILGNDKIYADGSKKNARMWFTGMPQERGRSGGALFDKSGDLLGIALIATRRPPRGYYCHTEEILGFLRDSSIRKHVAPPR